MGYNIDDSVCLDTNITETCAFLVANGTCLFCIGVIGTIMSTFTIYCLIFHVKLPYCQNFFILNVAVSDILIAIVGIFRGLGILNANYVGIDDNGVLTWWCYMYTIAANSIWMAAIPVLVPLTFDRFVAVVFSLHYKTIINTTTAKIMVALTWIPILMLLCYDSITYAMGTTEIAYQKNYHRCVIETDRSWKPAIFLITPFIAILVMYVAILFFVRRVGIETKKLLIMSTAIIGTGLIAYTPDTLLITFKVRMSYEAAQITTVTLYYMNSIWNPIIYFCTNRYTRRDLAATALGKKIVHCVYGEEAYAKGRSSTGMSDLASSSFNAKTCEVSVARGNPSVAKDEEVSVAKGNPSVAKDEEVTTAGV